MRGGCGVSYGLFEEEAFVAEGVRSSDFELGFKAAGWKHPYNPKS